MWYARQKWIEAPGLTKSTFSARQGFCWIFMAQYRDR